MEHGRVPVLIRKHLWSRRVSENWSWTAAPGSPGWWEWDQGSLCAEISLRDQCLETSKVVIPDPAFAGLCSWCPTPLPKRGSLGICRILGASRCDPGLALQYHINKLSIMSSENHLNHSDKDVDEVDAALSDLEITLEGGKTSTILVRAAGNFARHPACFISFFPSNSD